ncbi:MAG: hypothetical protein JRF60_08305 [Deltaproteobacteria bacterium]|nr:hypothetical protein [Deltaproteobacteria bacterium]
MKAQDMLEVIKRKTKELLDIQINIEKCSENIRIQVDSYSIVLATIFLLSKLKKETYVKEFDCIFEKKGQFINFDLLWHGSPVKIEILKKWDEQFISIENESIPLTLKEVIKHHEGEIWSYSCKNDRNFMTSTCLNSLDKTPGWITALWMNFHILFLIRKQPG